MSEDSICYPYSVSVPLIDIESTLFIILCRQLLLPQAKERYAQIAAQALAVDPELNTKSLKRYKALPDGTLQV